MNKFKNSVLKLAIPPSIALVGLSAFAEITRPQIGDVAGITGKNKGQVLDLVVTVLNYTLAVIAVVSVIMILYGGFLYVTGGTSEDNTKKAKSILLYAIIGIIVSALAFTIVTFANSLLA